MGLLGPARGRARAPRPGGLFGCELTTASETFVVEGRDGRLYVEGEDRGAIEEGDRVTLAWDGVVRVNGKRR